MMDVKVLPSDLWFEILRTIPTVDLLRLKAVCKTYHLLICNDLFTRLQLEHLITKLHSKSTRAIIISSRDLTVSNSIYDPERRTIRVWHHDIDSPIHRVIDSFHGLLLIRQVADRLLLCNPITRSYKSLPWIGWNSGSWKIAYDDVLKQYKVFGLAVTPRKKILLYVFYVHQGEEELNWPRETTVIEASSRMDLIKESVLENGNVHWLGLGLGMCIVSVNVTTEEVKTRGCYSTPLLYDNIFAANGKFYLGQSFYPNGLKIWGLEGAESENPNPSWMMKHCIETLTLNTPPRYYEIRILGMFCCKVLIMIMTGRFPPRLCQYDLISEEFEAVTVVSDGNIGQGKRSFESFRIVEHIDSLISLGPRRLEQGRKVGQSISYPVFPCELFCQLYIH